MFEAFLDIEGAFDSTSHIIIEAARWHGHQRYNLLKLLKKKHSLKKSLGICQFEQKPAKNNDRVGNRTVK
jgi:hypothetical protein